MRDKDKQAVLKLLETQRAELRDPFEGLADRQSRQPRPLVVTLASRWALSAVAAAALVVGLWTQLPAPETSEWTAVLDDIWLADGGSDDAFLTASYDQWNLLDLGADQEI